MKISSIAVFGADTANFPADYVDFNCPSYKAFGWDTYSPGGRMWLIRAWLNGEIETSPHFAEILLFLRGLRQLQGSSASSRSSRISCRTSFRRPRAELVNEGRIPPGVRDYFKAIAVSGNPYKLPQEERGKWAGGTGLKPYTNQEYLFYAGCVGSYDEVGQKMARYVGKLLVDAGVSVGILGNEETCDGNEVEILGETGLFAELAEENIEKFKAKGVKKIITLDPHALNTFKKDYPELGGKFEVFHYTEILAELIKKKKIKLKPCRCKSHLS